MLFRSGNDIMLLKRDLVDYLIQEHIHRFVLLCDNVLNFHGSDDCYYEEWYDDVKDDGGWICLINTLQHVEEEMVETQLPYYVNFGEQYNDLLWQGMTPKNLYRQVRRLLEGEVKKLV